MDVFMYLFIHLFEFVLIRLLLAVPATYIKTILSQFCVLNAEARAWEFKKAPDNDFVRTHPKLVESYMKIWRENSDKYASIGE
jgi:hypothetical protein